jgi:hypothetical protein
MKKMKSFRLYVPEAPPTPERIASDYTDEERAAFAKMFKPFLERYRKRENIAHTFFWAFGACCLLVIIIGGNKPNTSAAIWGFCAMICWALGAFFAPPLPKCPACRNHTSEPLGEFCPECGSRSLFANQERSAAKCRPITHRTRPSTRRGRKYYIRYCTHCGLHLDEDGL